MYVSVKNIRGTTDRTAPYGFPTWQAYWESKTGRSFGICSCASCSNKAEVGAHVMRVGAGREWYIVPLCRVHNNVNYDGVMMVDSNNLVPVN